MATPFESSAARLRATGDGGPGFCVLSDQILFHRALGADTPLLIALDTNVLIDLVTNAGAVIGEEPTPTSAYGRQLAALGELLDIWMVRDVRFVPLLRSLDDSARGPLSPARARVRRRTLDAVAEALSFQTADWEWDWAARSLLRPPRSVAPASIPGEADRTLVEAATALRCDVFLTRDDRVLAANGHVAVHLLDPIGLLGRLNDLPGSDPFGIGGLVEHPDCRYSNASYLLGDMGKIGSLLSAMTEA